jgi:hypothetical protein
MSKKSAPPDPYVGEQPAKWMKKKKIHINREKLLVYHSTFKTNGIDKKIINFNEFIILVKIFVLESNVYYIT